MEDSSTLEKSSAELIFKNLSWFEQPTHDHAFKKPAMDSFVQNLETHHLQFKYIPQISKIDEIHCQKPLPVTQF